jgi:2-oxoisovalerate dehydrogenase E2 component (dihydrolipoyl transacylase)
MARLQVEVVVWQNPRLKTNGRSLVSSGTWSTPPRIFLSFTPMLLSRFPRPFFIGRAHSRIANFHNSPAWWARKLESFKLADIGEGITECEVISWCVYCVRCTTSLLKKINRSVKPLAKVQAFDVLCEVQSDKASVEITSPFDGVVKELLVQEGEVAKVGSGLCVIEVEEENTAEPSQEQPAPATTAEPPQSAAPTPRKPHPMDPSNPPDAARILGDSSQNALAVPSVRHFARQNGIFDLSQLAPGTGKNGRIEKKDIEAHLAESTSSSATPVSEATLISAQEDTIVELGRTRYNMWKAMVKVRSLKLS